VRISDVVAAFEAGQTSDLHWRKNPSQTTGSGIWFDLSLSAGTPVPNYYIGLPGTATALTQSNNGGLPHGPNVSPASKYLVRFLSMTLTATAVPLPMLLMDYLLFYPFIEQTAGEYELTNVTPLPRYADGAGVQIIAVLTNAQAGGQSFFLTYTNSDGVADRVTSTVICNTQTVAGTLVNTNATGATARGPFIPLQAGDTGVQSIQKITWAGDDFGLVCLVLVKPLFTHMTYDITAPSEWNWMVNSMTPIKIEDDAFLGQIVLPTGTIASSIQLGDIETVWIYE
jgi:hypothetical protein